MQDSNIMLSITKIVITKHALSRYKERIDSEGNARDLERIIRYKALPVKRKTAKKLKDSFRGKSINRMLSDNRLVFFIERGTNNIYLLKVLGVGVFLVVTCFVLKPNYERRSSRSKANRIQERRQDAGRDH